MFLLPDQRPKSEPVLIFGLGAVFLGPNGRWSAVSPQKSASEAKNKRPARFWSAEGSRNICFL